MKIEPVHRADGVPIERDRFKALSLDAPAALQASPFSAVLEQASRRGFSGANSAAAVLILRDRNERATSPGLTAAGLSALFQCLGPY